MKIDWDSIKDSKQFNHLKESDTFFYHDEIDKKPCLFMKVTDVEAYNLERGCIRPIRFDAQVKPVKTKLVRDD